MCFLQAKETTFMHVFHTSYPAEFTKYKILFSIIHNVYLSVTPLEINIFRNIYCTLVLKFTCVIPQTKLTWTNSMGDKLLHALTQTGSIHHACWWNVWRSNRYFYWYNWSACEKMPMNVRAERWEVCLYQDCKNAPTFDEATAIFQVNWKIWLILKIHPFTSL